jgi:hypothetical protein
MRGSGEGFDLTGVGFIKRISLGSLDVHATAAEPGNQKAMDLLNRCLEDYPKGRIIGGEMSFDVLTTKSGHQTVLEKVTYHVGFARRPSWLED